MRRSIAAISAFALIMGMSSTPAFAETAAINHVPSTAGDPNDYDAFCAAHSPNSAWLAEARPSSLVDNFTAGTVHHTADAPVDTNLHRDPLQSPSRYTDGHLGGTVGRIGGSPNMFQLYTYDNAYYPDTLVTRTYKQEKTDSWTFTCDYYSLQEDTSGSTTTTGNPGVGDCIGNGSTKHPGQGAVHSNENSACHKDTVTYTYHLETSINNTFTYTQPAADDVILNYRLVGVEFGPVAGSYQNGDSGVVCISPTLTTSTKKGNPGTWTWRNGYNGGSLTGPAEGCNTPYYNIAPPLITGQTLQNSTNSVPTA
jgi:hypothetical protein